MAFSHYLPRLIRNRLSRLRGLYWSTRLDRRADNLRVESGVNIHNPAEIELGYAIHLFEGCILDAKGSSDGSAIVISDEVMIREYTIVRAHRGKVSIGRDSFIGPHCVLQGPDLTIGDKVMIAAGVKLFSSNHEFQNFTMPMKDAPEKSEGISIGDDVWIGANAIILDGISIASHSVIGAGAVVTKDVDEGAIVVGNPARPIGSR